MRKLKKIMLLALLAALCFFTWWALYFMVMGAITSTDELNTTIGPVLDSASQQSASWSWIPSWPTLQPVVELLLDTPSFFGMFWNTCKLVFPQVVGQIVVATPAAWVFSKMQLKGKKVLYFVYILLMVLPFQITMVPNYLILEKLGLMDTLWSIVLPGIFSTFPVFIIKKSFDSVPDVLLEAAMLDGANPFVIFFRIGIPLGIPGILSATILDFLEAWNAIEQPMLFLKDKSNWPLSLYLANITTDDLGQAMVASLIMLLPPLLLFLCGQKLLERGVDTGGIKE